MGARWSGFGARLRFGWDVLRFFIRRLIEYIVAVWLLGLAPFVAHLAAALQQPANRFQWVPNDLYLFLMVIGGNAAVETFQDRKSDGPIRIVVGVFGVCALLVGAWAYGSLEVGRAPVNELLRAVVLRIIAAVLTLYLCYKIPFIVAASREEAKGKRR